MPVPTRTPPFEGFVGKTRKFAASFPFFPVDALRGKATRMTPHVLVVDDDAGFAEPAPRVAR
jgi:hypothetical protein